MSEFLSITGQVAIVAGTLIFAVAALGIVRFPDAYTRISAVGTAGGLGITLVIAGAVLLQPTVPDLVKAILAIALQLATSAVGTMAIARSAFLVRSPLRRLRFDELSERAREGEAEDDAGGARRG
ncbi:monovalent cation/H(+) antiporter subunit G [Rothia sp. AR01]|uniref:Monovalent cation/H(+) antiporter subunit G n=1 Tax=Rothia santali TaxID=2949643 RepID=A0A9X2HCL6_9MICC|nr:monovalent cation/H(+) antiporter subunit G [Rothia santali]MCP3425660.1 monovalent cation/H(+) antiporter subunit G [Rothia santali]